ncbi:hypothetical protein ZYGR_0U02050 [Zygosaccharomyces rouxii]|uniref:Lethal giant larvae (Lgl)-like C-terminal domain-containing protein n=1 Tax=Zygosaccharomyces rouxii TaxID=4956 RepID=A0A1Q3A3U4_ZYGRO|nr:hypothetical protein ZYGR_0U02050 [Zygosaccharomyces rouxii]
MFGSKKLKNVSMKLKSKSSTTNDDSTRTRSEETTPSPLLDGGDKNRGIFGKRSSKGNLSMKGALESPKVMSGGSFDSGSTGGYSSSSSEKLYAAKELNHYGLRGKPVTAAFDFTQSLLAVATEAGEIHVFGKQQVEVTFVLRTPTRVKFLRFVKGVFLIAIDNKNIIMVFSLYSKKMLTSLFSPGQIECIETDPTLDWLFLGFHNGLTMIYDVDHDTFSDFKIENLQKTKYFPREGATPVKSIQWNPRDMASILISYNYVTVVYSLVEAEVKQHFIYELPPYAPGGEYSETVMKHRKPKVVQSLYHPNSLHIMTLHEDNSMVFWDANTGQLIQARTIFETDIHIKQNNITEPMPGAPRIKRVNWICQSNPEYTSLLLYTENEQTGCAFTMIDLGGTPLYSLTTYESMSKYYANTKNQKLFPLEKNFPVIDFLPIPRKSPHFSGCHDPSLILILLGNGEMETMMYPSGLFTYKATLFPQTLSWIRPHATTAVCTAAPRKLWFGMMSATKDNDGILQGGMPIKKDFRVGNVRSALATGHTDGSIRIWDASHNELSDSSVFEVSLSRILNKATDLTVEHISFAPETLELAAATTSGEVTLFKFEVNQFYNPDPQDDTRDLDLNFRRFSLNDYKSILIDVRERSSETMKQGFMPALVVNARRGKVSTVKNSNVGFVCIGYKDGTLIVVDRRGPVVTFIGDIRAIPKLNGTCVTYAEFGTMEYGTDGYSSVILFCGTNAGDLIVFKLIPNGKGTFDTHCVDCIKTNSSAIFKIDLFSKKTGRSCVANMTLLKELSTGVCDPGCAVLSSSNEIRVIRPGKSSEYHRSFKVPLVASSLCFIPHVTPKGEVNETSDFVTLQMNGDIKILSIPDMKEHISTRAPVPPNPQFAHDCYVLRNGDIFIRLSMSESSLLSVVNNRATGLNNQYSDPATKPTDMLYNPTLQIPFRPQVNSLQWARGTVYCTSDQIDQLLGGENRPPSKYEESKIAFKTISRNLEDDKKKLKKPSNNDFSYQRPVKNSHQRNQSYFKGMSRAWENKWDNIEDKLNDYAADMSEGLNEMFEETTKNMAKGAFGI